MDNKKIVLSDAQNLNEIHWISRPRGHVIFKDPITGETLLEKPNKVIISGSVYTMCAHFPIDPWIDLPTYDTSLSLDGHAARTSFANIPNDPLTGLKQKSNIWLFCCGTDGCGSEDSQIYDVDYKKRIDPTALIPFRYQLQTNDLSDELRALYFGRKTTGTRYAYYFKTFESEPVKYMRYVDGTAIDSNLYTSSNSTAAEVFMEMNLQITKEDFRDYFIETSGISSAKINNVSLCSAWRETDADGYTRYRDITPVTQLNIANESLIDTTKGIDITYQLFY